MLRASWTGKGAAALVSAPYSNVDAWDRDRVVRPSIAASGPGSRRGYSWQDLIALAAAVKLRDAGVPRSVIRLLVSHVQERGGLDSRDAATRTGSVLLFTDGVSVWEVRIGEPPPSETSRAPVLYVLTLGEVIRELRGRIRTFRIPAERTTA